MAKQSDDILAQYEAFTAGAGFVDLGHRTQIEFTGADRASFLHNLCTNEVKKLAVGSGCEAFITNVQGKIIGHGYIFSRAESLVFDTVHAQGVFLYNHFEKYHIREKVVVIDRSNEWSEILLAGSQAIATLTRSASEVGFLELLQPVKAGTPTNCEAHIYGIAVSIRRVGFAGSESYLLSVAASDAQSLFESLSLAGEIECSRIVLESARMESGTPLFGIDITDKNLPQEVGRDAQAISFTKGCYLGQETVARIDALGHVNQYLCGVRFTGEEVPAAGTSLTLEDKVVGHVTSAAWSPRLAAPLALAYIRRENADPGAKLDSPLGPAQIVSLPVA